MYKIIGDDWTPDEEFNTLSEAESFAKFNSKYLGSYVIEKIIIEEKA